jgi:hypothetical protein
MGTFLGQNNFPMKQWHAEHMEKTVLKYVKGLAVDASSWEKRNHKKYGSLNQICRQIEYDIKHGVTDEEVSSMLRKVRQHSSFSQVRIVEGSIQRLGEIEGHFRDSRFQIGVRR